MQSVPKCAPSIATEDQLLSLGNIGVQESKLNCTHIFPVFVQIISTNIPLAKAYYMVKCKVKNKEIYTDHLKFIIGIYLIVLLKTII